MGTKGYKIICGKCGGAGPYVKIEDFANKMDAQEEAKEAWNRRANNGTIDWRRQKVENHGRKD